MHVHVYGEVLGESLLHVGRITAIYWSAAPHLGEPPQHIWKNYHNSLSESANHPRL